MKETILRLHAEMEQVLTQLDGTIPGTALTDQSYEIATDYWKRVKQLVRGSGFTADADEIDFFKKLKVLFTGPLEYYLLLYRFQIYAGAGSDALQQFRDEETDRMRRFRETHVSFIDYYDQARTEWDDLYFLRRKFHKIQRPPSQVYDRATDFWSNGDWIVTLLQANRRFQLFLESTTTSLEER
jgi:hypothetical protein